MKLIGKIIINGTLTTKTGLHIGGSKSSLNIGGIDNNVIKTIKGVPYVPGSSLKGKLRSLLAAKEGSLFFSKKEKEDIVNPIEKKMLKGEANKGETIFYGKVKDAPSDDQIDYLIELFGYSGDTDDEKIMVDRTRLIVRDAFLTNRYDEEVFPAEKEIGSSTKRYQRTDSKWENVINRRTGTAEHPRQMERVPIGAKFGFELVYNYYEEGDETAEKLKRHLKNIFAALQLLEDDFIGGQGSRGYGQVAISIDEQTRFMQIDSENYQYAQQPWDQADDTLQEFYADLQKFNA